MTLRRDGARTGRWARATALMAALLVLAPCALAQTPPNYGRRADRPTGDTPGDKVMKTVTFEQKLDAQLPLDLEFRDESGKTVRLRDYFGKKPVIVNLVYYECPMLCTQVLNGLVHMMIESSFTAGTEYEVVTVSIDPRETPELAARKKQEYLERYNRPGSESGWHFLVGDQPQIEALADTIGFRYVWDEATQQYAHPSGIVVATPGGRLSHYYYGIQYPQSDVRLSLVEASESKIGSPVDQLLLLCYHYDPTTGRYGPVIMNIIRLLGTTTLVLLVGFIIIMLRRDRRRAARPDEPGIPA